MARFIFDCEDEVCLPAAYNLVDGASAFIKKMKEVDVVEADEKGDSKAVLKKVVKNMMVKHPKETGELLSKMWILENDEKAPNAFRTLSALFSSEVAVDFFTCAAPSLLQLSNAVLPALK